MTRPLWCLAVLAAGLFAALPARAQDGAGAVAADRPGFGDGSAVVAPGRFQAEAGATYSEQGEVRTYRLGQAVLRYGAAPRVEVRALLGAYVRVRVPEACPVTTLCLAAAADVEGLTDLALGAKLNLLAGDGAPFGRPNLTAILDVALPTGDDAFSAGEVQPTFKLALDLALTPAVGFSGNAGYAFTLGGDLADTFFTYASLGAGIGAVEGLGVFAGLYSLFPRDGDAAHGLDGGITFLVNPATQLDLNAGAGLAGGEPDFAVGAGIARRF